MTYRDYREIRIGDVIRHPKRWAWGTVTGFAPNGKPKVRVINRQYCYRVFPSNSVVCYLYEYDAHVKQRLDWFTRRELEDMHRRMGKRRFARMADRIIQQRIST